MSNRSAIEVLKAQYSQSFEWLQGTVQGTTDEMAHYQPGGKTISIAGLLGHTVCGLDGFIIAGVAGQPPLMASSFAGKTGLSETPPQGGEWAAWGNSVKIDLPAFHEYATAVFAGINSYLDSVDDSELAREIEFPFGTQTVGWALNTMILNTYSHTGEIACIKGLQGEKGYPF